MADKDKRSRIYPTGDYFLQGVPAVEMLVDADVADVYTSGPHPAFTRTRPPNQAAPSANPVEQPADVGLAEFPEVNQNA